MLCLLNNFKTRNNYEIAINKKFTQVNTNKQKAITYMTTN